MGPYKDLRRLQCSLAAFWEPGMRSIAWCIGNGHGAFGTLGPG